MPHDGKKVKGVKRGKYVSESLDKSIKYLYIIGYKGRINQYKIRSFWP